MYFASGDDFPSQLSHSAVSVVKRHWACVEAPQNHFLISLTTVVCKNSRTNLVQYKRATEFLASDVPLPRVIPVLQYLSSSHEINDKLWQSNKIFQISQLRQPVIFITWFDQLRYCLSTAQLSTTSRRTQGRSSPSNPSQVYLNQCDSVQSSACSVHPRNRQIRYHSRCLRKRNKIGR